MREILDDIFTWPWFSEPHGYNFNGHLIRHPEGNLCIDPVEPGEEELDEIASLGVARILLTNRSHSRASNKLRERTGARTSIHPDDAAHARDQGTMLDDALAVGQAIGPLVVVEAAGKSPGEVAFHWPERRLLMVGDAVIGNPPGHFGLLHEKVMDEPARLRQSVRRLLDFAFDPRLGGAGELLQTGSSLLKQQQGEPTPDVAVGLTAAQPYQFLAVPGERLILPELSGQRCVKLSGCIVVWPGLYEILNKL